MQNCFFRSAVDDRKHGAARLAHIEKKLFATYDTIRLQSFQENESAIRFYRKDGWHVAGEDNIPGIDKTLLILEKNA